VPIVPPFNFHGPDFIRAALHLFHRAERFGLRYHDREVAVADRKYGLSALAHYRFRFQKELDEGEGRALNDFAALPLPPAVADLFARDVDRWRRRNDRFRGNTEWLGAEKYHMSFFTTTDYRPPGLHQNPMGPSRHPRGLAGLGRRKCCRHEQKNLPSPPPPCRSRRRSIESPQGADELPLSVRLSLRAGRKRICAHHPLAGHGDDRHTFVSRVRG
jgi:hypothetical protein